MKRPGNVTLLVFSWLLALLLSACGHGACHLDRLCAGEARGWAFFLFGAGFIVERTCGVISEQSSGFCASCGTALMSAGLVQYLVLGLLLNLLWVRLRYALAIPVLVLLLLGADGRLLDTASNRSPFLEHLGPYLLAATFYYAVAAISIAAVLRVLRSYQSPTAEPTGTTIRDNRRR